MRNLKSIWRAFQDASSSGSENQRPQPSISLDSIPDNGLSLSQYHYKVLHADCIRVIILQPGVYEDPLRCKIQHQKVRPRRSYEALSYCWGLGEKSEIMLCGHERIMITKSLWLALKRLRSHGEPRTLWIDQISINQDDLDERAAQVSLMGEIYTRTEQVLIWLGEEDVETDLAFTFLETLDTRLLEDENFSSFVRSSHRDAPEWTALRNVVQRPWFNRLWVFQELVLASEAQFLCGSYAVSAQKFGAICLFVTGADRDSDYRDETSGYHLDASNRLIGLRVWLLWAHRDQDEWTRRTAEKHFQLMTLLKATRDREATEPSDKVFALLGLANDADLIGVRPDYRLHFRQVFALTMRSLINHRRDLIPLRLVEVLPGTSDDPSTCRTLPSWVPDFRYNKTPNLLFPLSSEFTDLGQNKFYNTSGNSKISLDLKVSMELYLRGVYLGRIESLSEPSGTLVEGNYVGKNVQKDGTWPQFASTHAHHGKYPPTQEDMTIAYARTLACDWLDNEHSMEDRRKRLTSARPYSDTDLKRSDQALIYATSRRRLFITDSRYGYGYMGLCHQSCLPGDEVWILPGGDMPFILRRLDRHLGTHEFKGEAYVHGVMDGEFLLQKSGKGLNHRRPFAEEQQAWLDGLDGEEEYPFATEEITLI